MDTEVLSIAGQKWRSASSAAKRRCGWRSSLRTFVIVGLSAVVPLVLLSLLFGYRASTQQRQSAEFQVAMRIDGAAHRLDGILSGQAAAVLGVAGFRSVALGEYLRFFEHLQLMPRRHPEWLNIVLVDSRGERLIDLRSPFGAPLPLFDPNELPAEAGGNGVVIGGIAPAGKFAQQRSIPIYAPILGKDGRRLVMIIALDPTLIASVVEEAGLPADWRGAVLDDGGMVVARTGNSPLALGERADQSRHEGEGKTYSLTSKIAQADWTMLCDIPNALLDKPVNDAWWLMLVLGGGALGLAVVLASLVAADVAERQDIDERKRAEAEHRTLLGRLHSAQEEERLRIARDLHDGVGQSITGLSLVLKRLESIEGTSERKAAYDDLKAMILDISRDVHRAAVELRPTALDDFGLSGAIETYLREWRRRTDLSAETVFTGLDEIRLPPLVETTAYRIIVELFTNIARHAGATAVGLTLSRRGELLTIVVEDNGRGMDGGGIDTSHRHLGLLGIRERLELIGGEMHIETAPGKGTAVFVRIPVPAPLREAAE
jgi:signal transduction histidine kinase